MPFPLSKIRRLSDFHGMFSLHVTCLACKHERVMPARILANYLGPTALMRHVVHRLRCSRCGGRRQEIWVIDIPR